LFRIKNIRREFVNLVGTKVYFLMLKLILRNLIIKLPVPVNTAGQVNCLAE
jgi:hypothetical protein